MVGKMRVYFEPGEMELTDIFTKGSYLHLVFSDQTMHEETTLELVITEGLAETLKDRLGEYLSGNIESKN